MRALVLSALLLPLAASGQETAPPPEQPPAETPPTEAAPQGVDPAVIEGKVASLEERLTELFNEVGALKKVKFSGYIQPRYVYNQSSRPGLTSSNGAAVNDGFTVRRARLKAQYTDSWAQAVLQIDAVPTGVTLKDAEAWLIEPWTGKKLSLVVGQTKWPFSYEVIQSSGDREFPERTRVVRAFAPGERDRGAKLLATFGAIKAMAGIFDGNGTDQAAPFIGVDNDRHKDVVGRIAFDFTTVAGGISGWYGWTQAPDLGPTQPSGNFRRTRLGADIQLYLDLLPVGGTAVKAELIRGNTWTRSRVEQYGVPAFGWYALVTQSLWESDMVGFRYDYFDGLMGAADAPDTSATNSVGTWGLVYIHYFGEAYELTLAFERPLTAKNDAKDNVFTAQFQVKY